MKECGLCRRQPPDGFASVYEDDQQVWLCHPDDLGEQDCYTLWQQGRRPGGPGYSYFETDVGFQSALDRWAMRIEASDD